MKAAQDLLARVLRLWSVLGVVATAACLSELPATEVLVRVESDLTVPAELSGVNVTVYDATLTRLLGQRSYRARPALDGPGMAPLSFSIAPEERRDRSFQVVISGVDAEGREVVRQQQSTQFAPRTTQSLLFRLSRRCYGKLSCSTGFSCNADTGDCGPVEAPPPTRDEGEGSPDAAIEDAAREQPAEASTPPLREAGAAPYDAAPAPGDAAGAPEPRDGGAPAVDAAVTAPVDAGSDACSGASCGSKPPDAGTVRDGGVPRACLSGSDCKKDEFCDTNKLPVVCEPAPRCPDCNLLRQRCVLIIPPECQSAKSAPCPFSLRGICIDRVGQECNGEICEQGSYCCNSCSCVSNGASCLDVACPR